MNKDEMAELSYRDHGQTLHEEGDAIARSMADDMPPAVRERRLNTKVLEEMLRASIQDDIAAQPEEGSK